MLDFSEAETLDRMMPIVARIAGQHGLTHTVAASDHLVDVGFTSMAMVDLMLAIEAEFDLAIPQREMTPSNFQSAASLALMLDRVGKA